LSTPLHIVGKRESVPVVFSSDKISDQTSRYHNTSTVRIKLDHNTRNRVAYLCFYDNNDDRLSPVGWGKIRRYDNLMIFKQVPHHVLFFPAIYEGKSLIPICKPFIVNDDGQPNFIEPQGEEDMTLYRKYPEKRKLIKASYNLLGASILGGDTKEGQYDTLGRITSKPVPYVQDVAINNSKSYRFYKIETKDHSPLNIAEIQLLGINDDLGKQKAPMALPCFFDEKREPKEYSVIEAHLLQTGNTVNNAVDGDVLSYTGSSDLVFCLEFPQIVKAVRYLPRNANNIIVQNEEYVLYYYNKGWVEFGDSVATSNCITFRNVPAKTVYLLANNTDGTEEMPFYYVNGKQVFINTQ